MRVYSIIKVGSTDPKTTATKPEKAPVIAEEKKSENKKKSNK